jgi:outer membrane protein assembly factor BamE (lipoprotein component of BamABCDE complex)
MIIKKTILVFFLLLIISCTEKITYTGLIIDEKINYSEINNKNDLLKLLGQPNYIDPMENNFYYFSEKNISKNSLTKKTVGRLILVYYFDDENNIINTKRLNLDDEKTVDISENRIKNDLIKKGLIEKIFGGVSAQPSIPTTSE